MKSAECRIPKKMPGDQGILNKRAEKLVPARMFLNRQLFSAAVAVFGAVTG